MAYVHARRVHARFVRQLDDPRRAQEQALVRALHVLRGSALARHYGLDRVGSIDELRRTAPITTYEDLRPFVDRVAAGDTHAMFAGRRRIHMFASSSGTTAQPKLIPVTSEFVADYRRGWNVFGLKMLSDHPDAVLRAILQGSGRYDSSRTTAGIPVGAITGLLARSQKGIVRRFYVGRYEIAHIADARARYYTLMRLGLVRDVAFAITANPSTLIQMARVINEESERAIRDVRDGTLSREMVADDAIHAALSERLRPAPGRARELEDLRRKVGVLRPSDYWKLVFLACWTGGSMGHYLERLAEWWGPLPVRDLGLLASEGRVTIPFEDNVSAGVLDVTSSVFEFIPASEFTDDPARSSKLQTLLPHELETGHEYVVVLTNVAGLVRYRLDDVVRVDGFVGRTPVLAFLHRAGRVSSLAGEKLTESQVVAAVEAARRSLGLPEFDFVVQPAWGDPPFYVLRCATSNVLDVERTVDRALGVVNEEYLSRRETNRLGSVQVIHADDSYFTQLDESAYKSRRGTSEQYKRSCLVVSPISAESSSA